MTRWVSQATFRGYASRANILLIMKLVNRVLTVFQCSVYFPPSVLRNRHGSIFSAVKNSVCHKREYYFILKQRFVS